MPTPISDEQTSVRRLMAWTAVAAVGCSLVVNPSAFLVVSGIVAVASVVMVCGDAIRRISAAGGSGTGPTDRLPEAHNLGRKPVVDRP